MPSPHQDAKCQDPQGQQQRRGEEQGLGSLYLAAGGDLEECGDRGSSSTDDGDPAEPAWVAPTGDDGAPEAGEGHSEERQHADAPDAEVDVLDRDRDRQRKGSVRPGRADRGVGQRLHDESIDRAAHGDDGTPQYSRHEAQPGEWLAGRAGHLLSQADEAADDQEDSDDDRQVDDDPGAVPGDRLDGRGTREIGGVGMQTIPDQADDGAGDEQRAEQPVPVKLLGS